MLMLDGPIHPTMRPTLVFGARENLTAEVTVYGPKMGLHSGHYGNWVPNPGMRLAQLLACMKDEDGRVKVAGYYDGITLTDEDRLALASVPDDESALIRRHEALQYPSLASVTPLTPELDPAAPPASEPRRNGLESSRLFAG